jgi:hypothetical protein
VRASNRATDSCKIDLFFSAKAVIYEQKRSLAEN